jgi:hypothetical protein
MENIKLITMKKVIILISILSFAMASFGQVQFGGTIKAKDNAQLIGEIMRNGGAIKTSDSALLAKLNAGVSVTVGNFPGTQAVTGTFWQATQPISGSVSISGSAAVTGTFWQATQPVSGTFWQATQPVSIASMPSTPVTGTFWQTTQPVSAAALPLPSGAATSTKQSDGTQKTQIVDGSNNVVSATANALDVNIKSGGFSAVDAAPSTQNITAQDIVSSTGSGANSQSIITGTPTANSAASFTLSSYESIKVQVTGSWTGTLQPEVSIDGGTTWYITGIHQTGTPYTVASFTANFSGGLNVSGVTNFRIRATAAWTGTATIKIIATANPNSIYIANGLNLQDATVQTQKLSISAAGAAKVDGSAVTQPVSGTVTANAGTNLNTSTLALEAGGNLAAIKADADKLPSLGQTTKSASQPTVFASDQISTTTTGQSAQTATVNNIIPGTVSANATDVSQYRSFSIQIVSTGTAGTFIFEGSVDNSHFVSIPVYNFSLSQPPPIIAAITATSSNIIYVGACQYPFLRVRIATTITGGSIQAFTTLSYEPFTPTSVGVFQATAGNLNANITTLSQFASANSASDGFGVPNTTDVKNYDMFFNGTNYDRVRGNFNTTTGDAGAKVANGNGATQVNYNARGAVITALLGTISGTFTTFQFQLQWSPDAGTTWLNYGPATTNTTTPTSGNTFTFFVYPANISQAAGATPANLTTGATSQVALNTVLPRTWRVTWVIAGTSPSATITGVYVNYQL